MPPVRYILDSNWFFRLKEYFFSVYENTLFDLMIFCILIVIIFFGRNIYMKYAIRKARNNLPLVIGGWGTRGKSSVERLKVAIINALGYSLLSKTTGCEAMFIHGHPFSPMREMFLFRPYDKATIWEQHHLTRFAHKMNCDVVLWECMGLTPPYVKILQKEWMKDDLSTITNTYPDHEDIQGPAGINLPEVMTNFIPENSKLITTEEQMLPILNYAAERFNSQFEG
ncbi:MAG: poly-gamma-glutamate synthase PgsB, partial [Deltaproteobacteria bacterium]|nr:poly-gamma-glutamate synthase PgsB [Deltaproteobacteria bacterium]